MIYPERGIEDAGGWVRGSIDCPLPLIHQKSGLTLSVAGLVKMCKVLHPLERYVAGIYMQRNAEEGIYIEMLMYRVCLGRY